MDNKVLLFDANIAVTLPQPLRVSISKRSYEQIMEEQDVIDVLTRFSASKTLMCTSFIDDETGERLYSFFTLNGKFFCKYSPQDGREPAAMFAMKFTPAPSFDEQNIALTQGHVFLVPEGIIVRVKLNDYEEYFCLRDGQKFQAEYFDDEDVIQSVETITEAVASKEEQLPESPAVSEGLESMLDIAEQYAKLENELAEAKTLAEGNLPYQAFNGTENTNDRTAATLIVKDFNEDIFKEKSLVTIEDKQQTQRTAEVMRAVKSDDGSEGMLELLFKQQLDFQQFKQQGVVTPKHNNINMIVQLAAINRIRNGSAPAAFFLNDIFDGHGFGDFTKKDMRVVDGMPQSLEKHPNKSQIDAIKGGINTNNVFLVMGPPGTGKTTVILEWVKYFVAQEHLRVLIASQSNNAVDNVLERIKGEPGIDMIRIGSVLSVQPGIREFLFEKKITRLREAILAATTEKLDSLNQQYKEWNDICFIAAQLKDALSRKQAAWDTLQQQVEGKVKPTYQRLCCLCDAYDAYAEYLMDCGAEIQEKVATLNSLKQKSTGLRKVVYWFPLFYNRRQLNQLLEKYSRLRSDEGQLIGEYNMEYQKFAAQKNLLRKDFYQQFSAERESAEMIEEKLKSLLRKPLNTSLGLFADIKAKIEQSFSKTVQSPGASPFWQMPVFFNDLQSEMKRCKDIMNLVQEWQREVLERQNYSLQNIVLESVNLVGATCIGVNSQRRFAGLKFDVTIIDEAGQIQIHNALVPMSLSKKLIMLGDHRQIPPFANPDMVTSCKEHDLPVEYLSKSLFEMMYESFPESNKIMLDTQYRMPGEIADTLSRAFYDGNYHSIPQKRGMESELRFLSHKPYIAIDTSGAGSVRYEQYVGKSCRNDLEVEIIEAIVKKLMRQYGRNMDEVGIISAYKKQVEAIVKRLRPLIGEKAGEISKTLDSFQGQERDVIIYSFTRSSRKPAHEHRIGFLNELRRLNVAMSRPKKTLVMIGDIPFLQACEYIPPVEDEDNQQACYQRSDKRFSMFIRQMVDDVKKNGDYIPYDEFLRRMKG